MYSRPINSVVRQKLLEKDEQQQAAAAGYFQQGLYYAKYPHRDVPKCTDAFMSAIESITTRIPKARWSNKDYSLIMQSYQQLVSTAVCSRTASSQQRAASWREQAMSFFNHNTDLDNVNFSYFIIAFSANLDCANGIHEDTILLSQKMTVLQTQAIASIATDMIKIIEQLVDQLRRPDFTGRQLRELADCHSSLGYVYYLIGDHKNSLKYYSIAIEKLANIPVNENDENDFRDISIIYGRLAIIYYFDKNYRKLFECACDYFSGDSRGYDALKKAIVQNSMDLIDNHARNAITHQLMTVIGKHRKNRVLSQNAKHVSDFKSMQSASHRNMFTRSSLFSVENAKKPESSTARMPQSKI